MLPSLPTSTLNCIKFEFKLTTNFWYPFSRRSKKTTMRSVSALFLSDDLITWTLTPAIYGTRPSCTDVTLEVIPTWRDWKSKQMKGEEMTSSKWGHLWQVVHIHNPWSHSQGRTHKPETQNKVSFHDRVHHWRRTRQETLTYLNILKSKKVKVK